MFNVVCKTYLHEIAGSTGIIIYTINYEKFVLKIKVLVIISNYNITTSRNI